MPIEIRELVIKATVREQLHSPLQEKEEARKLERLKREILEACMEQVREMIVEQQKR